MSDPAWSPPETDFKAAEDAWSPPAADFEAATTEPETPSQKKFRELGGNQPHALDDMVHSMASGAYHGVVGGYKGLGTLLATGDINRAADAVSDETDQTYQAPDSTLKRAMESKWNPLNYTQEAADAAADWTSEHGARPAVSTIIKSLPTALGAVLPIAGPRIAKTVRAARAENAANAAAEGDRLSMGAAHVAPDVSGFPPEYQKAFADASDNGPVNLGAHARHVDALTLPLPDGESPLMLRKGQATRNGLQISDEKNMRTDPDTQSLLANSMDDQSRKLGLSMGEIQRRATPTIVQRSNAEHGQAAVDRIKNFANQLTLDTRAKYKALKDANGGTFPVDGKTLANNVDASLVENNRQGLLPNDIQRTIDKLRDGHSMNFDAYEQLRSDLADATRAATNGRERHALTLTRNQVENLPLLPESQHLKGLADDARSAAKRQFDIADENPAYEAAINDNVPKDNKGLHKVGADSPLAESFMSRFFLGDTPNASRAYIQRLKQLIPDPELHQAIEGATLNKLREAAKIDPNGEGTFAVDSYNKARRGIEPKADSLLSPQAAEDTEHLRRVANDVNFEDKSSATQRSGTALMLQRMGMLPSSAPPSAIGDLAHHAADAAIHSTLGPAGNVAKSVGMGILKRSRDAKAAKAAADAKLKFAIDATKPGAGLDDVPPRTPRASGGRVLDVDALVDRLVSRWRAAKRETDAGTKPLLHVPDEAIVKALAVAKAAV